MKMNELDEKIADTYRKTNSELIVIVRDLQKSLYRCNFILFILSIFLSISVITAIIVCCKINSDWIDMWNSYEYATETTTYTQDGNGINNFNSGIMGDIENGANNNDCEKK